MPQLPLYNVERDAFARGGAGGGGGPWSAFSRSIDNAEQRANAHPDPDLEPGVEVLPGSGVAVAGCSVPLVDAKAEVTGVVGPRGRTAEGWRLSDSLRPAQRL